MVIASQILCRVMLISPGLHCLLFQATQNNLEPSSDIATVTFTPDHQTADPSSLLQEDFSGNSITTLADELVSRHGSSILKRINSMLDRWRVNWDLRSCHDLKQENRTFSGDPVKFWWLAKLYLVLHFYRHVIRKGSEFAIPGAGCADKQGRIQIQLKIISWLFRFRRQKDEVRSWNECYLAQIMKPMDLNN